MILGACPSSIRYLISMGPAVKLSFAVKKRSASFGSTTFNSSLIAFSFWLSFELQHQFQKQQFLRQMEMTVRFTLNYSSFCKTLVQSQIPPRHNSAFKTPPRFR